MNNQCRNVCIPKFCSFEFLNLYRIDHQWVFSILRFVRFVSRISWNRRRLFSPILCRTSRVLWNNTRSLSRVFEVHGIILHCKIRSTCRRGPRKWLVFGIHRDNHFVWGEANTFEITRWADLWCGNRRHRNPRRWWRVGNAVFRSRRLIIVREFRRCLLSLHCRAVRLFSFTCNSLRVFPWGERDHNYWRMLETARECLWRDKLRSHLPWVLKNTIISSRNLLLIISWRSCTMFDFYAACFEIVSRTRRFVSAVLCRVLWLFFVSFGRNNQHLGVCRHRECRLILSRKSLPWTVSSLFDNADSVDRVITRR